MLKKLCSMASLTIFISCGSQSSSPSKTDKDQKVIEHQFDNYGILVFQPTHVTTELYATFDDNQAQWDSTSDLFYPYKHQEQRLNLAVRGEGRVSVGLGAVRRSWDNRGLLRQHKGFGGSFGVRIGDGMYLAAGMNRITEEVAEHEDKQWNEFLAGIGFAYGDPDSSMFRFEASMARVPEVIKGTVLADINQAQTEQVTDLEILLYRILFSAKNKVTKTLATLPDQADQELTQVRYGFGYRRLGFSWIFYQTRGVEGQGDNKHEQLYYKTTVGFGFL